MAQVEEDARALDKAMSGWHKDNSTIIRIVLSTSLIPQRSELLQATYKQTFNRDLVKDLRWTTSGMFKKAIEALMLGPVWLDVNRLLRAFPYSPIPPHQPYAEVILYRTTAHLEAVKEMYLQRRGYHLEEHVALSSKRTRQLLQLYVKTSRPDDGSDINDVKRIEADARTLFDIIPRPGKEADISAMLARCSHQRLIAISDAFRSTYALRLEHYITGNLSGDFQQTLIWLFTWARDPGEYGASVLRKIFPFENRSYMSDDERTVLHTILWCHWNRSVFEAGKAKLDAQGFDLRRKLEKRLPKDPFRELVCTIYDGWV